MLILIAKKLLESNIYSSTLQSSLHRHLPRFCHFCIFPNECDGLRTGIQDWWHFTFANNILDLSSSFSDWKHKEQIAPTKSLILNRNSYSKILCRFDLSPATGTRNGTCFDSFIISFRPVWNVSVSQYRKNKLISFLISIFSFNTCETSVSRCSPNIRINEFIIERH